MIFLNFFFYLYVPIALLENLKENINLVKNSLLKKNPQKIISSKDLHFNIGFKIQTYFYKLLGTELIYIQHGGNYGIDYIHQFETYEINCSDKFISWGWKYKYKNVFPLTQPALNLKLKKKTKKEKPPCNGKLSFIPLPITFSTDGKKKS